MPRPTHRLASPQSASRQRCASQLRHQLVLLLDRRRHKLDVLYEPLHALHVVEFLLIVIELLLEILQHLLLKGLQGDHDAQV